MQFQIVQHCFGREGSGGPVVAMERLLRCSTIKFGELRQIEAAGGISFKLLFRFVLELRRMRPQLIHVRGLGNEGFHAVLAARLAGIPNILVSVHGTHRDLLFPGNQLKHWIMVRVLEPLSLIMATHIATVCEYASLRQFLLRYKSKIVAVVPNGVELPVQVKQTYASVRDEFNVPNNLLLAITVSRVTEEKGYLILAKALFELDETGHQFCLLIVGSGDADGSIRACFDGLRNIVVLFVGHRSDVARFLAQADFFIFPSLHENLSNALLEAMANGLPVIATQVGGNTEVVSKGGGVLVSAGAPVSLANAIRVFLTNDDVRHCLGIEATEVVRKNYTVEHMVKNWLNVYKIILKEDLETF